MMRVLPYVLLGYLSGSLLWAKLYGRLVAKTDITALSPDGNPGASNAFQLRGRLPEDREVLLEMLDSIISEMSEDDLLRYRRNLPHL